MVPEKIGEEKKERKEPLKNEMNVVVVIRRRKKGNNSVAVSLCDIMKALLYIQCSAY